MYLFIHLFLIARFYLIKRKSLINTDKKTLINTDENKRVPMYYLWIPLAVLVILVKGLF